MRHLITLIFITFMHSLNAQCTLEIESMVASPVSCNGLSDGEVTVNAIGGNGAISFSSGGSSTIISPNQPFNTSSALSTASGSGPLNQWWSPSSCTGGPYIYSSTLGCPAGSAVYNGGSSGFSGCFLRSPQLNMNGIDEVTVTFDLSNSYSASRLNDRLRFYCWVNNGYMSVPANYTINGISGQYLYFDEIRDCQEVIVKVNLSGIPTASRSDFLFYIETSCQYSNCAPYQAIVDNIVISQAAASQASNVFSGLPSGDFQVTVTDASGCSVTQTVFVPQPEALLLTTTSTAATTVDGTDGTATVIITGGNNNPQISWNTNPIQTTASATGLSAGNYTVTVTDSEGCSAFESIIITEPSCIGVAINSTETTPTSCFGNEDGSITVMATSPNGTLQYQLNSDAPQSSNVFTGLPSGIYFASIIDPAGCSINTLNLLQVSEPDQIIPIITISENQLITDNYASYQWYLNDEEIAGATEVNYSFSANGTYTVHVTDINGCEGISEGFNVLTTDLHSISKHGIIVYPNPFTETFVIQNKSELNFKSYRIYASNGQLIQEGKLNSNQQEVSLINESSGIYSLQLIGKTKSLKFNLIRK
jgi:hypothetical protein